LIAAAEEACQSPARLSARRRQIAAEIFYRPGSATRRALQACYALLELTPPPAAFARNDSNASNDLRLEALA
jgi:hypothetical protein